MLEPSRPSSRSILLLIDNEGLRLFLSALLEAWQFTVTPAPRQGCLVLAEDGQPLPPAAAVIRLTPGGVYTPDCLPLPLRIEDLWSTLETRFHRPSRGHLRIALRLPLRVTVRGEEQATVLHSLSDAGARFLLERELVCGEQLELAFTLGDVAFVSPASVIYSFASAEQEPLRYETGVIFIPSERALSQPTRRQLRQQIILRYLTQVRARIPGWAFINGLARLDLPPELQQSLDLPVETA